MIEEDAEYKSIDGATIYVSSIEVALTLLLANIDHLDQVINKYQRGEIAHLTNEALGAFTGRNTWAILYSAKLIELVLMAATIGVCFVIGYSALTTLMIGVAANIAFALFASLAYRGFTLLANRANEALVKRLAELNRGYVIQLNALKSKDN
jgi:hypothetical protein